MRTDEVSFPVAWQRLRIDSLFPGGGIDGNYVLQAQVFRVDPLSGFRVENVVGRLLAGSHDHWANDAVYRHSHDLAFKHPVEIPLIVRQMLVIPDQLAGIGVDG